MRLRKRTYNVTSYKGVKSVTDIFTVDLTLAEIKTLRVRQKNPLRDPNFDDLFQIPTLEEYIIVATSAGRPVGIYPELKTPEWFNSLDILKNANTTFEDLIVKVLNKHGYTKVDSSCYLQSFSKESLKRLSTKTKVPLIMLYGSSWPLPNAESKLTEISRFCAGVGVWKDMIIPTKNKYLQKPTEFMSMARKHHLKVHAYTFRNENKYLAWNYTQDPYNEYEAFFKAKIDGYFTDFPSSLKRFLDEKLNTQSNQCISAANSQLSRSYLTLVIMSIYYMYSHCKPQL